MSEGRVAGDAHQRYEGAAAAPAAVAASARGGSKKAAPPFCRLLTGDELGLIRVVEVPAGPKWEAAAVVARWGVPSRTNAVVTMAVDASSPNGNAVLAVARHNGSVELMSSTDGAAIAILPPAPASSRGAGAAAQPSNVCALCFVQPTTAGDSPAGSDGCAAAIAPSPQQGSLVSCTTSGLVRVHARTDSADAGGAWSELRSFQACSSAACMAVDHSGRYVAVGGDGCNVSVWDLSSGAAVWKAKGNKPNMVGLVDLPYITALAFLPPGERPDQAPDAPRSAASAASEAAAGGDDGKAPALTLVAGTAKHKLWLYRTAVGRRPQLDVAWGKARVTALFAASPGQVWASNGTGTMEALDVATQATGHGLRGAGGSVRALAAHPVHPSLLASAGLDRFVRVHDTASRRCLAKVYLKQQLTGVVFAPVPVQPEAEQTAPGGGDGFEGVVAGADTSGEAEALAEGGLDEAREEGRREGSSGKRSKNRHGKDGEAALSAKKAKKEKRSRKQDAS